MEQPFTHLDSDGKLRMVDVSDKEPTLRDAEASCLVVTSAAAPSPENPELDGAIFAARLAGIQAAKRTATLIPLCHPLALTDVQVDIERHVRGLVVRARAVTINRTGVEMEALTACSFAALSLVHAFAPLDATAHFEEVVVRKKSGGRSGEWGRGEEPSS